jgi:pimeloyl-ACP methyl ester carboxylesterase
VRVDSLDTTGYQELPYRQSNNMNKKTIICIPGLGASKASFSALTQTALGEKYHVTAVDLPGFGELWSETVPDDPIAAAAGMLARRVEQLGGQNVVLVGHSLGGAVAILAAGMLKNNVIGLASIEGNLIAEDCGMSRRLANATRHAEIETVKKRAISEAARSDNPGVRAWAEDAANVSLDTLAKYSRRLVERSDSGELLRQFLSGEYRKLYLYGDDYIGHPVLPRLEAVPREYVRGAGHINFTGDAPHACAHAISNIF